MSDRNCDVCGVACGDAKGQKKFVVMIIPRLKNEIVVCKGCLMRGTHAASGSHLLKDRELVAPILAFPRAGIKQEFIRVAQEEEWRIGGSMLENVELIDTHYKQSLINNFFQPGVGWKKDVRKTQLECFRKSCKNILNHYASWLAFQQE